MQNIVITEETASEIIAFIKMHERDDVPDEVWDFCMKLIDEFNIW